MAQIIRFHQTVAIVPGQSVSTAFLDEMGVLMVWGTSLLYIDAIAIILFYEKLGRYLQRHIVLRFAICGVVILSFDQAGFMGRCDCCSTHLSMSLRWLEGEDGGSRHLFAAVCHLSLADIGQGRF